MTPFAPGFGKRVSLFHGIVFSPGVYGIYGGGVGIGVGGVGVGGVGVGGVGGGGVFPGVFGGFLNNDHGITIGSLPFTWLTDMKSTGGTACQSFVIFIDFQVMIGFVQLCLKYIS